MSKWVDRISSHPALARLRKLAETLDATPAPDGSSTEVVESLERLSAVARFALAVISAVDPLFVPVQVLLNLVTPIQEIENQVGNFRAQGGQQFLDTANAHADSLLVAISSLRQVASPEDAAHVREAVTALRKSASNLKHNVEEERRQVVTGLSATRKSLEEAKADIGQQKARLDAAIATFQEQFSKAEDERRSQFSATQTTREERLQAIERDTTALQTKTTEQIQETLAGVPVQATEAIESTLAKSQRQAEEYLAAIGGFEARARELVFLTANTTTVGSYKLIADKQRWEALVWRILAALSFAGLIVFAVWAFVHATAPSTTATWLSVSGRFFAALTFGLLGAFAAREANRFAELENRNRRTELALAALGPFLQGLPQELQDTLRQEVARGIFVENVSRPAAPEGEAAGLKLPAEKQIELAEKALDTAQKIVEKLR